MTAHLLPNLIIAGVMKAATTSLYTYLSRHPDICASSIKETNYFMPLAYGQSIQDLPEYTNYFKHYDRNKHKYNMEASPEYFYGGRKLAMAIHEYLGLIKVIIVLREPIDRLLSFYKHVKRNNEIPTNMSFDLFVNTALEAFRSHKHEDENGTVNVYLENVFVRGIAEGFYIDYLRAWDSIFGGSIKVGFFENLRKDPLSFMIELCNWLKIDPMIYRSLEFTIENRSVVPRNKLFHRIAGSVNVRFEKFFRKQYQIKRLVRNAYLYLNEAKEEENFLSDRTHKQLESLYAKYNTQLLAFLKCRAYSKFPTWLIEKDSECMNSD